MSVIAELPQSGKPEDLYRHATPARRRVLAAAVMSAYRSRVVALVRAVLRGRPLHWAEGEQAAALGLMLALEKYDAEIAAAKGASFWTFAYWHVSHELSNWIDNGVFWRKETNRGNSPQRRAARERALARQCHISANDPAGSESILDTTPADQPTPEELVAEKELRAGVVAFVERLPLTARADLRRHDKAVMSQARSFFRKGAES